MEKITSTSNDKVKETAKLLQKKFREETGFFIVEGEKAIEGLCKANYQILKIFIKDGCESKFSDISAGEKYIVNDAVMSKISSTKTPGEIIAVAKQKRYDIKNFLNKKFLILLENIKDAGNLGTILRTSKAFEVEGILLLGDTIDLYNPKVIRASVGCFDIPVINIKYEDLKLFKNHNIYSTALYKNSIPLKNITFKMPFIIAFGSEAEGLSDNFLQNKTVNFNIETSTCVESLNLASAVSICLYEIFTK